MAGIDDEMKTSRQAAEDIVKYDPDKVLWNPSEPVAKVEMTPEQKRNLAIKDMARRLRQEENSKLNPKGGWDAFSGRWYPHDSHEGGAQTIGYGKKLSNGDRWTELVRERERSEGKGYLTDAEVEQMLAEDTPKYYDAARSVFDRTHGEGSWDALNHKQQSILADYEYNVKGGLAKYEKLMKAAYDGDVDAMLRESPRYSGGKPLGRNKGIAKDIDSLRSDYPVTPVANVKGAK